MKGVIIAILLAGATAHASVSVFESKRPAVTEGDAVLACDVETAYREATDVTKWQHIFPGIVQAIVTKRQGNEARVTFVHDDGTKDKLHFKNQPAQRTMWFEQVDGDADVWCWTAFQPGATPGTTRVHTWFYADVSGAASWFVSSDKIKSLRQQQVRTNLTQLQSYFARNARK